MFSIWKRLVKRRSVEVKVYPANIWTEPTITVKISPTATVAVVRKLVADELKCELDKVAIENTDDEVLQDSTSLVPFAWNRTYFNLHYENLSQTERTIIVMTTEENSWGWVKDYITLNQTATVTTLRERYVANKPSPDRVNFTTSTGEIVEDATPISKLPPGIIHAVK